MRAALRPSPSNGLSFRIQSLGLGFALPDFAVTTRFDSENQCRIALGIFSAPLGLRIRSVFSSVATC